LGVIPINAAHRNRDSVLLLFQRHLPEQLKKDDSRLVLYTPMEQLSGAVVYHFNRLVPAFSTRIELLNYIQKHPQAIVLLELPKPELQNVFTIISKVEIDRKPFAFGTINLTPPKNHSP
ncbi:MAG: hypothetical protein D6820_01855, partial [Lentisphaerae bacterium]